MRNVMGMKLRGLLAGCFALTVATRLPAEIVSQGAFVAGAVDATVGVYSTHAALDVGTGSSAAVSGDYAIQSGAMVTVQNRPHVANTDGRLFAVTGTDVVADYADVLRLSGAKEFDGESLVFRIATVTGALSQNGQPVSTVILAPGDSFVWRLPSDVTTIVPALDVVAVDAVGLASAAGARLTFESNLPPVGNTDEVFRPIGLEPFKIRVADLLANDTDSDNDTLAFGGLVNVLSGRGRTLLVLDERWIVYYPAVADEPSDDSFSYAVSDGRGGMAQAVVWVRERVVDRAGLNIVGAVDQGGGQLTIRARGIPGRTYQAQVATTFTPPTTIWANLGDPVQASPTDGSFVVSGLATSGSGQRFYRTIEVTAGGSP